MYTESPFAKKGQESRTSTYYAQHRNASMYTFCLSVALSRVILQVVRRFFCGLLSILKIPTKQGCSKNHSLSSATHMTLHTNQSIESKASFKFPSTTPSTHPTITTPQQTRHRLPPHPLPRLINPRHALNRPRLPHEPDIQLCRNPTNHRPIIARELRTRRRNRRAAPEVVRRVV